MNTHTKQPSTDASHLSEVEFHALLTNDNANDKLRAGADHLETCLECQSRLTTLAADSEWWSDAQTLLGHELEPRWEPDLSCVAAGSSDLPGASDAVDRAIRDLLETPRHPEMFGRLGRYDIERVIGHGGMGIVLKAHDSELNRPIAIKLLAGHLAHVGAARERFAREGRAAAAVVHEHVVAIHNVESNGKVPYLVMQYVPGRSLQARVDEDGPLGTEEILRIGMQAASGLAAAHRQGLVHRDVKPSNILLEDTVERAVLTDFGLARTFDDASLTHTGIVAGTPHYMSPEQAMGEPIDGRSDLFSLGAVLYFMATGHPPFRAASAMAVLHRICHDTHRGVWQRNNEIPDALCDVVDRLLEKKPAKRFSSAEEVQQHLATLLSRLQQHGLGRRRFRGWRSKRFWKIALPTVAAMATAIVAGITIGVLTDGITPPRDAQPVDIRVSERRGHVDAQLAADERRFLGDFESAEIELNQSSDDSFYFQQGNDLWHRELESLRRDLDEYERRNHSTIQQ
jgi:serine/threonine protein kinase